MPPGRVRLRFQGSGASGTLELTDVSQTEEIALTVVVNGSTVELESQERVTGSQAQLEGKVASVNYAARSLVVGTTTVMVPEGIPITNGFRALELQDVIVGARIHAKGSRAGDTMTATSLMVQQTGLERVTLSGVVSDLGGACPTETFKFGSQVIAVNASTIFVQGACSDLTSGATVEVKGFRRTDGSVLATMVKFKSRRRRRWRGRASRALGRHLGAVRFMSRPFVPCRRPRGPDNGRHGLPHAVRDARQRTKRQT